MIKKAPHFSFPGRSEEEIVWWEGGRKGGRLGGRKGGKLGGRKGGEGRKGRMGRIGEGGRREEEDS